MQIKVKEKEMKISECIDKYIEQSKEYLKERTVLTYFSKKKGLIKIFGDADIDVFTQEYLQNYINECQKQGTPKKTICGRLSLLFLALKPYKTYQHFRFIAVEQDRKEKKVYSESDIKKIANYIIEHPRRLYTPILIAIYTGMRVSEITGLKWEDIDFENRTINVRRNATKLAGHAIVSTPKTKNGVRSIYLTDVLYEYLENQKKDGNFYVCTGSEEVQGITGVQRSNQLLCKKLGIECCGMHAYRHAFASKLLKESTDFKTISEVMGHSNIGITQNIYNHTTQERRNEVIEKAFVENKPEIPPKEIEHIQTPIQTIDYRPQINALQSQMNKLMVVLIKLTQYVQDNLKIQEQLIAKNKRRSETRHPKYKVIDGYGNTTLFYSQADLLEGLDISGTELKKHLNGYKTILDELEIYVEVINEAN